MYNSRTPTEEDIISLSETIREDDIIEIFASIQMSPKNAIDFSIKHSEESIAHLYDDKILAITGIATPSLLGNIGTPWLITGEEVRHHPIYLVKNSIKTIDRWLQKYHTLQNYIDVRYKSALKWAYLVGFSLEKTYYIGLNKDPFIRISARRDTWVH